jgi:hypothetical protein
MTRIFAGLFARCGYHKGVDASDICWYTTYEYADSVYVLTRVDLTEKRGWNQFSLDENLSDPMGSFRVYWIEPNKRDQKRLHGRITIKSEASGTPLAIHPDFDLSLLGSPTLWPASARRFEKGFLAGYVWRTVGKATPWINDVVPKEWDTQA